jgi:hypothetical protein
MNTLYNKFARRAMTRRQDDRWAVVGTRAGRAVVLKHGTYESCAAFARSVQGYEDTIRMERRGK